MNVMHACRRYSRDYSTELPVDDETFADFARQFDYAKTSLHAKVDKTIEYEKWKVDVVSINVGYSYERMSVYVYSPIGVSIPLQPVIYFPGEAGLLHRTFDPAILRHRTDSIIESGRALIVPTYKGTYQRHGALRSTHPCATVLYKDHVIAWGKEIGRTIDYLETREDIQAANLAYLGVSWGGFLGGILPAIERRIKAVVLNAAGMAMETSLPEVDQINYLPRVTQPVLMLNGRGDRAFPYETSQKPMFDFLGTPIEHKKLIVYETGHVLPRSEYMKATLAWLDAYLGPVAKNDLV